MRSFRSFVGALLLAVLALPVHAIGYASPWVGSSFTTTLTTTGGTTQATGSVFLVGFQAGTGVSSVTDSYSNTYTLQKSVSVAFGASTTYLYACVSSCAGGASHTATVTLTGGAKLAVAFLEIPSAGVIDSVPTGTNNGSGATTLAAPSITTTAANEWVVNFFGSNGALTQTISDSGGAWTIASSQQTNSYYNGAFTYAQPATTSTLNDTLTVTTSDSLGALAISIKAVLTVTNGVLISNGHPVKSGSSILFK